MCGPIWPFLLMYGSHDMRHIGFPQVDDSQRDPRKMGRHGIGVYRSVLVQNYCMYVFKLCFKYVKGLV